MKSSAIQSVKCEAISSSNKCEVNSTSLKFPDLNFPKKIKHFNSGKELYDFLEKNKVIIK
jgi:hypothetical protein